MTPEKYPPISPGTSVKTTQPNWAKRSDWTNEGWASKRWGVKGSVLTHHDSHGLCYDVRHEDGTEGTYDPSELEVVGTDENEGAQVDPSMVRAQRLSPSVPFKLPPREIRVKIAEALPELLASQTAQHIEQMPTEERERLRREIIAILDAKGIPHP